ncbi:MAG: BREX system Lon protease-like protein BrxL [Chloroflexota bacterium]|nr:BREX system Lon protease-like protein BrxL [Chloroflexota bacterium]
MNKLDHKINQHFQGLVVRKDLVKTVKGNAIVPSYVLEYLLGQYCATSDKTSIEAGIETVRKILREHYVHRNEADLVKSNIREKGYLKVIDKISARLNDKKDAYEISFSNLGIREVLIDADTIKRNPKLLVSGVWCIAEVEYQYSKDKRVTPWMLESLKPVQVSRFNFEQYLEARQCFTTEEWVDLLMQSIGLNPEMYGWRDKLTQLTRLIPYCERNYNLIELGPKGTGKSHIYSEFSPHGILISGGEVTVPKLFVNNRTGKIGLVGYWSAVAFDEFTGQKRKNTALVDILKNYMANKSFSRGIETLGAEASMVFVGNTNHNLAYMLKHEDLFEPIPEQYYDSAFLDRLHFYIPGWEMEIIRDEMFSEGYGFILDYFAEILRHLRDYDYSQKYAQHFELLSGLSTRDQDGINKTFSGLMKILFPSGEASREDMDMILMYAAEGRKRVKDQLMRIDPTYAEVTFGYQSLNDDVVHDVKTLEEKTYPQHYYQHTKTGEKDTSESIFSDDKTPIREELDEHELIDRGESDQVEFKSTLRWNLYAGQIDKDIEYSVLKTIVAFLNKEGGTLLVGIEDDGSVLGIEPDRFSNEDKYLLHFGNLVNDKIGKQHADYIRWGLREIQSKRILRVDCSPSPDAVFLEGKDGEEFYIRTGPASVQLSASEVLEYSRKHFR